MVALSPFSKACVTARSAVTISSSAADTWRDGSKSSRPAQSVLRTRALINNRFIGVPPRCGLQVRVYTGGDAQATAAPDLSRGSIGVDFQFPTLLSCSNTSTSSGGCEAIGLFHGYYDIDWLLSLIHISEPTRQAEISYAVFCLKKKT